VFERGGVGVSGDERSPKTPILEEHVNSNSRNAGLGSYAPDGLDEHAIDRLIAQVAVEVSDVSAPTSALVDGSAAERRRRRMERRILAAVVRSLPARSAVSRQVGEAA
jgi:hypothetical protein